MATHVLYIDDSGTKEYSQNRLDYGKGNTRYFVFGGVFLTNDEAARLSSVIIRLKLEYFGTETVEVKSNWLRLPKERMRHYGDSYGISEEGLNAFIEEYYNKIIEADLVLLAAIVDKQHMQEDYEDPWYPPAIAYEVLLQRVQNELGQSGTTSVVIDDMSGATPHGNQYKSNLSRQHQQLKRRGSGFINKMTFPCLTSLKFVNSAQSHLIQVADISAYNVYRQFTEYGEQWEIIGLGKLPTYDYFKRIAHKFRCDTTGRVQGYGVVKLPLRRRVRWSVGKAPP